jgi:hypothetical protein
MICAATRSRTWNRVVWRRAARALGGARLQRRVVYTTAADTGIGSQTTSPALLETECIGLSLRLRQPYPNLAQQNAIMFESIVALVPPLCELKDLRSLIASSLAC